MTRAQLAKTLLLALAPLTACGRTEDEITDWTLLQKGGATGSAGRAGAGGGTAKAGTGGATTTGGAAGSSTGGKAGAGAGGAGAGGAAAGGASSIVCINGVMMPFGNEAVRRCFEPFEGGCPEIGLGIVQPDLPDFCGITCQFGGPVPPEPGDPGKCCYLVEEVCEGRPLFVGGRLVTAGLVRRGGWSA